VVLGDMVSIEVEVVSVLELLNTKIVSNNLVELVQRLLSIAAMSCQCSTLYVMEIFL
jgi:hypothetical protein